MASFSDNFNRADGALGANWTVPSAMSGLQIVSLAINGAGAPSVRCSVVATATAAFADDQECTITVPARGSSDYIGPAVRCDLAGATGYAIRSDGTNNNLCRVIRFSGTTQTVLTGSTINIQYTAGDTLTLRAVGPTITVLVNGSTVQSFTDTNHTSGQPGVFYRRDNNGTTRGDDFTALDLGASPTRLRRQYLSTPRNTRRHFRTPSRIWSGPSILPFVEPPVTPGLPWEYTLGTGLSPLLRQDFPGVSVPVVDPRDYTAPFLRPRHSVDVPGPEDFRGFRVVLPSVTRSDA